VAIVGIFDFRGQTFNLELLRDVDHAKKISQELPEGSLAVVAYTVNLYGENQLGFNVMWCGLVAEMKQ
jgi:hypothetical protein